MGDFVKNINLKKHLHVFIHILHFDVGNVFCILWSGTVSRKSPVPLQARREIFAAEHKH